MLRPFGFAPYLRLRFVSTQGSLCATLSRVLTRHIAYTGNRNRNAARAKARGSRRYSLLRTGKQVCPCHPTASPRGLQAGGSRQYSQVRAGLKLAARVGIRKSAVHYGRHGGRALHFRPRGAAATFPPTRGGATSVIRPPPCALRGEGWGTRAATGGGRYISAHGGRRYIGDPSPTLRRAGGGGRTLAAIRASVHHCGRSRCARPALQDYSTFESARGGSITSCRPCLPCHPFRPCLPCRRGACRRRPFAFSPGFRRSRSRWSAAERPRKRRSARPPARP